MAVTSVLIEMHADNETVAEQQHGAHATFLNGLVGYMLRQASNSFMTDFAASMAGTGLRPAQVSVLSVIEENPGAHQGDIGRTLGVARANMAPLMSELEAAGFVRREPDAADRRAVIVSLTSAGRAVLRNCKARITAQERRSLAALTEKEQQTLLRLLKKI